MLYTHSTRTLQKYSRNFTINFKWPNQGNIDHENSSIKMRCHNSQTSILPVYFAVALMRILLFAAIAVWPFAINVLRRVPGSVQNASNQSIEVPQYLIWSAKEELFVQKRAANNQYPIWNLKLMLQNSVEKSGLNALQQPVAISNSQEIWFTII